MNDADSQSTTDFRAIIEGLPVAIVAVSENGTIVFVNSQTEELFGWSRLQLVGEAVEVLLPERLRTGHPQMRAGFVRDPSVRPMGKGRDLHGVRSDGREFPLEIGLKPIATGEGRFVLATIVDLTERKLAERQLQAANESLEASNAELQQFAYISSHDLKEPLRTVSGYAQLLQQEYSGELDDEADDYIFTIVRLLRHMQRLIDDLGSLARVESQALPLQSLDLNSVLEASIHLLEASIRESDALVTTDALPDVLGDEVQLTHVFTNLIGNAIKFVADQRPRVHVSATSEADFHVITVTDQGIGIDSGQFDRIFEVFRRLDTSPENTGTGFGLALCRRVVHRHGGRIWVESVPGQGASFRFTLRKPRQSDPAG